ncbi:pore-forming ESAT-6 family protein [Paracoccus sp. (in: a-proteobacteria)]|uniref:pore-forming ESAT-6 family protein n=1 Tax=Paracoccus sp. TaxID=267 RepID=UPI00396D015C
MIRHLAVALTLGLGTPVAALAQEAAAPSAPDSAATYEAARNQLGILKYCQQQGFTGGEAVATQAQLVDMLPEGDEAAGATAEEKGAAGTVAIGDAELSLADASENRGSTVEATCQQIEAAVNEVAPSLQAG